jgi:hypothetical protein
MTETCDASVITRGRGKCLLVSTVCMLFELTTHLNWSHASFQEPYAFKDVFIIAVTSIHLMVSGCLGKWRVNHSRLQLVTRVGRGPTIIYEDQNKSPWQPLVTAWFHHLQCVKKTFWVHILNSLIARLTWIGWPFTHWSKQNSSCTKKLTGMCNTIKKSLWKLIFLKSTLLFSYKQVNNLVLVEKHLNKKVREAQA